MRQCLLILALLSTSQIVSANQEFYGNGYTIVRETPINNKDLQQIINKSVKANTIQQGLNAILNETGWQLAGTYSQNPDINRLFNAPWPNRWQFIGPDSLENILKVVGGEGWTLVIDPINRMVGYELNPKYQRRQR